MNTVEKAGMLVNVDGVVMGWIGAGDSVEMTEGDTIVSDKKAATKLKLADQFAELKAANTVKKEKAVKEPKAPGEGRARKAAPKEGQYTVLKTTAAVLGEGEVATERNDILVKLFDNTDFAKFWDGTPEKFQHPGRDGVMKSFATSGLVNYAISRGMIEVA